ncbi:ATP-binding protein [Bosea sp. (in: a-proteobacteria)]|uniref:AlbA family DNA-binding domain-containing protein n=1 Tax=Bosea sp. (in: a-proteobacteria) TaxID=1871050 RepID=UPI001AD2808E|nr:ATP-binding protein [Bosea sp. (in: a-proteobacteria)]MBN9438410.1 ATP-binding protein [Bosea sp. (in: a-proteobacteria)]
MAGLFEQLRESGENGLQELIQRRQQEHVQLDFKQKTDASHPSLNDDDRRTLGEALSGFSNSAGGLLIWGVDARKKDGIDCANELKPIGGIEAFQSNVTTLVGQFLMPRHEGIRTAIVPCKERPGYGYLLLHVERSERRPHRSEAKGKRGYFKRVGDSFFEMEHYDIEDAFTRLHVPALEFRYKFSRSGYSGNDAEGMITGRLEFRLHNSSTKMTKFPHPFVRPMVACALLQGASTYRGYREEYDDGWRRVLGVADAVINPETSASVFATELIIDIPSRPRPYVVDGWPSHEFRFEIEYRFGYEDSRMNGGMLELTGDELVHLLKLPARRGAY